MSNAKPVGRTTIVSADRITVRFDDVFDTHLRGLMARFRCTRSEAIRYAVVNAEKLFKSEVATFAKIESSMDIMITQMNKLNTLNHEAIRVPSFYEYRVRAIAEEWDEIKDMNPNDVRAIMLVGKRYAMQYGKIPDPADKKRFGVVPSDFNATEFLKRVATLVNAAHVKGYGE